MLGLWLRGLPVQSRVVAQLPQALASALGTVRNGLRFSSLRGGSQRKAVEGRIRRQRSFRPLAPSALRLRSAKIPRPEAEKTLLPPVETLEADAVSAPEQP
jgi:hypothetical protein